MSEADLVSFAESFDRCWMEGRLDGLKSFLADDVVFVAPGGSPRTEGAAPAVESYRQFLSQAQVERFQPANYQVTMRGDAAVVEYQWQMTWSAAGMEHDESGREVLVLSRRAGEWRIVWRTQIPVHG